MCYRPRRMQVSTLMIRALSGVVERAGGSRQRFLAEAGLEAGLAEDMTARLPVEVYRRAIAAALHVTGDPAFGLHMGEQASSLMFDVLGPLIERADTLRQAIETMNRYARLAAEGHEPQLHESGTKAAIRFPSLRGNSDAARLTAEFALCALLRPLEQFAGSAVRPTRVAFAYREPPYSNEYRRIFGDAVQFGQAVTELVFPRAWLDRAQRYRSPELYALLQTQAERTLVRIERDASLAQRIEHILSTYGPRQIPTMDAVARELELSARSLRRRLRAEGVAYAALVERSRVSTAKRMLEQPNSSIQETAYAMGFAAPTAFYRAFKRWTGLTPRQYQASF